MFGPSHHEAINGLRRRLFGYACALCHDIATAEDLYQDALVRALSARSVPADKSAFRVWMFRIVRNLWIDRTRAAARQLEAWGTHDPDGEEMTGGEDVVVNRISVRQAFMRLGKDHRDVLALVDIAGFSYSEAAELLDLPQGTIMSRTSRARAALARQLHSDDKVVALPASRLGAGR